jgi:hypothetical protein
MKNLTKALSIAFLIGGLAIALGAAKPLFISEFEITVETTANGFTATCQEGCAWTEVSFRCGDGATSCQAVIDEKGVGSVEN